MTHILKEKIGLPVWDGESVVDIRHLNPGDTVTAADFKEARQSKEEQEMLIKYNCVGQEDSDA